jgi:plasmid stabilization system protein ParE
LARVTWREDAVSDLEEIERFVARDSAYYAKILIERIIDATARLEVLPLSGRLVPELADDSIREVIVSSYRIIHRVAREDVEIVAVLHGARTLPELPG